jgi:hypothetical protein
MSRRDGEAFLFLYRSIGIVLVLESSYVETANPPFWLAPFEVSIKFLHHPLVSSALVHQICKLVLEIVSRNCLISYFVGIAGFYVSSSSIFNLRRRM